MKRIAIMLLMHIYMLGCCAAAEESQLRIGSLGNICVSSDEWLQVKAEHMRSEHGVEVTSFAPIYYDNIATLQMALNAGDIDAFGLADSSSRYIAAQNDNYVVIPGSGVKMNYSLMMLEGQELYEPVNSTITALREDGTLDQLIDIHIEKCIAGAIPAAIEMPEFEGAPVLRVAVSGDLPPIDYVAADGTPAGFNLALLAEIGQRCQINIEVVVVENMGRAIALNAGRVDAIFFSWSQECAEEGCEGFTVLSEEFEGSVFTEPYFEDSVSMLMLK